MRHRALRCRSIAVAALALAASCSTSAGTLTSSSAVPSSRSEASPSIAPPPPPPSAIAEAITVDASDAAWTRAIDRAVGRADVSVAVGTGTRIAYLHLGEIGRIPASVQKLLTSMVALDTWGPLFRFPTIAVAEREPRHGVVQGDAWIVGAGDPTVDAGSMARLAGRIDRAGVERYSIGNRNSSGRKKRLS